MGESTARHDRVQRFVIQPIGSVRSGSRLYGGGLPLAVGGCCAAVLSYLGLWPIGVWMLGAMAVLGVGLWVVQVRNGWRQVISICSDQVIVETGQRPQHQREVFRRGWVRLEWRHPDSRNYVSRLFLRSHGRAIEIGSCLTVTERDLLARQLLLSLPVVTTL